MSFWTTLLKTALRIGSQTVTEAIVQYNSPVLDLTGIVLRAITTAEGLNPEPGAGENRAQIAAALIAQQESIIRASFAAAGRPIRNPEQFTAGILQIQNGIVAVINATSQTRS